MIVSDPPQDPPSDIAGYDPCDFVGQWYWDPQRADRAVSFVETVLVHVKGPLGGRPLLLQDWQRDLVRTMFGWVDSDGMRRYRLVWVEVPRKNGKTTLAAAIALLVLFCDAEHGAEVYSCASTREQASLCFNISSQMIRKPKTSILEEHCVIRSSQKTIRLKEDDSFYRAIPAEVESAWGYNASCVIADEVHAWGLHGREFWEAMQTSQGARSQALTLAITTAGYDRNSICYDLHSEALRGRDGGLKDDRMLPCVYAAEQDDDWTDPAVWQKANPGFGVSVMEEYIRRECWRAKRQPSYENTFRRLHLNQWTSQENRWISMEHWRRCPRETRDIPEKSFCFGGLDLATSVDLTAFSLVFPQDDGTFIVQMRYWIPEEKVDDAALTDRVPYRQWCKEGWIEVVPGASIDFDFVHTRIEEDCERYQVKGIGFDPWNAEATRQHLEKKGIKMVKLRQVYADLAEACNLLEKTVVDHALRHQMNPILEWNADNVAVQPDQYGNNKPVRPVGLSDRYKIDGVVALLMALSLAVRLKGPSIYETPGQLAI